MKKSSIIVLAVVVTTGAVTAKEPATALKEAGITGGLVVHLGCGGGEMTAALRTSDAFTVHGLDRDLANVEKARKYIQSKGLYGPVSVDHLPGSVLPYVDNLVRALLVSDAGSIPRDELMRVVCPGGVAVIDGKLTVKLWPRETAQWPQHYNTPDNNAVALDSVVGPPRYFRWIAEPEWSRSHLELPSIHSLVSAKGRLYSIEDRASVEHPALPGRFALICRDAFNGIELWRHPFPDWQPVNIYIKFTPTQLQRQLAAIGDEIYCTPGLNAPITVFDAATGKTLRQFEGTEQSQEFVYADGVLYVVTGDPYDTLGIGSTPRGATQPAPGTVAAKSRGRASTIGPSSFSREAYGPLIPTLTNPTSKIVAIDAGSGQEIWKKQGDDTKDYEGATLAVRGPNVVYALKDSLLCIDRKTGRQRWRVTAEKGPWFAQNAKERILGNRNRPGKAPGTTLALVLSDEAVYLAGCNALWAFSMKDGAQMWEALTHINHFKSPDLFLVDGVVWTANKRGYDARTGRLVRALTQDMIGPMSHDRCYRNRITPRWYINSATGGSDFLALDGSGEFPNHWARSTCGVGYLPCNGLLYLGPHACSCYNVVKLTAFNALASEPGLRSSGQPIPLKIEPRVEKGPAFAESSNSKQSDGLDSWPTYRNSRSRGGCTKAAVSAKLKPKWQAKLSPRISAPTIAEGKVFVADVDAHSVRALDADTGKQLWSYTVGGRVDSPPTWHKGRLLFGSRDGWVYCLRAKDGRLAWRFKGLPDRSICAYQQVESAWPVGGSILIRDDIAYFCAGRNSFIDGGMVLFGLDPETGQVRHHRHLYGPYGENEFPVRMTKEEVGGNGFGIQGNKSDILLADDQHVYLRHSAFTPDLTPVEPSQLKKPHLITTPGFVQSVPHHRSFWTVNTRLLYDIPTGRGPTYGDILVKDGARFYEVRGYQPARGFYFDPRVSGYTLFAGEIGPKGTGPHQTVNERWKADIPLTGKAMALANNVLFVAGTPVTFPKDDLSKAYDGRMGGVLWAASAEDGTKLAQYKLDAPPVWDSLAAVEGKLFLCTTDGQLRCFVGKE
ncbi:MAG: outer membrane protein assembly factor BamB family protein [Planctomycetota bacterium]|jgi:outer membrane protein assembly factor BamB